MDNKGAEIECLWICENKPDLFSSLIMWFFGTPYSHCAILVKSTGMIWHATTPGGVCEEPPSVVMKGCHIAASRSFTLKCSDEVLLAYLEGERGKPYGHRGNIGLVIDRLPHWMQAVVRLFTKPFRRAPEAQRNCSEFVGNVINLYFKPLRGNSDKWTPPHMERLLQPRRMK